MSEEVEELFKEVERRLKELFKETGVTLKLSKKLKRKEEVCLEICRES